MENIRFYVHKVFFSCVSMVYLLCIFKLENRKVNFRKKLWAPVGPCPLLSVNFFF